MIDPAVHVALLYGRDGALEPRQRRLELTGARKAVTHIVQAGAEARLIDPAVHVALLFGRDGALEPRQRRLEHADSQKRATDHFPVRDRNLGVSLIPMLRIW